MSTGTKDLYVYALVKKCSKCEIISLRSNILKDRTKKDSYRLECKICCRKNCNKYYYNNQNRKLNNHKNYNKKNRSKTNAYERQKRKTDFKYKLICDITRRTDKAFKSQNLKRTYKTTDSIGCTQSFFRRRNLHQLYGDMTEKYYGSVWTIDPCYLLSKTNLSNVNEMKKSTYWINLRPRYLSEISSEGSKNDNHLYLLQEIKANYFIKLKDKEE